jgi:CubicO group peptidase (beta-lactamase class C family)
MDQILANEVRQSQIAGIVTLISRHGKIVHFNAAGYADVGKGRRLQPDSIFRIYSMTKPVTSTALMMLYEEGRFQLTDPVMKYIPEFANLRVLRNPEGPADDTVPVVHAPTIQDLMRHTAGLSHGLDSSDVTDNQYIKANVLGVDVSLADEMTRLSKIPLRCQPGTRFVYSIAPDVQARLVEVLSGMSFDDFLAKRLFGPLGMRDTGFSLPADKASRLATVYWDKDGKLAPLDDAHGHPDGSTVMEPSSVNSYTADHKRKGGAFGLVSTAEDYWRFAQMILNGGVFNGTRILSPQTVHYMSINHLGPIPMDAPDGRPSGLGFGLGFAVVEDPAQVGYTSNVGSLFWWGLADTYFWIDPKEDLVVVAMTQHMNVPAADALLGQLRTLVYSALMQ